MLPRNMQIVWPESGGINTNRNGSRESGTGSSGSAVRYPLEYGSSAALVPVPLSRRANRFGGGPRERGTGTVLLVFPIHPRGLGTEPVPLSRSRFHLMFLPVTGPRSGLRCCQGTCKLFSPKVGALTRTEKGVTKAGQSIMTAVATVKS